MPEKLGTDDVPEMPYVESGIFAKRLNKKHLPVAQRCVSSGSVTAYAVSTTKADAPATAASAFFL